MRVTFTFTMFIMVLSFPFLKGGRGQKTLRRPPGPALPESGVPVAQAGSLRTSPGCPFVGTEQKQS